MSKWSYTACKCAPPFCPSIHVREDVDGALHVVLEDDYDGCCYMSVEEFRLIADNFLRAYHMGDIREHN
jgi:hypothetical protein